MARKGKKSWKEQQRELEAPDVAEEKLWSLSDWMEAHWKPVLGGLTAVSVLWGGVGIFQIVSAARERGRAAATATVFEQAAVSVVAPADRPEGADAPVDPTFDSEKARAEAVIKAAAGGNESSAGEVVGLVLGGAQAALGKWDAQLQAVDAALAKVGGSALETPLREQRATALEALGRQPEAMIEWQKVMASAATPFTRALSHVRIGDLSHPGLGAKAPDAKRAKDAYDAALKLVRVGDKDPPAGDLAYLAADIRLKLAKL
ncbi:MAG: hypothetical protein EXR79_16675 [Myxococcales bacterium]|nr:hypothetical protein [Myxococcales bacterium]